MMALYGIEDAKTSLAASGKFDFGSPDSPWNKMKKDLSDAKASFSQVEAVHHKGGSDDTGGWRNFFKKDNWNWAKNDDGKDEGRAEKAQNRSNTFKDNIFPSCARDMKKVVDAFENRINDILDINLDPSSSDESADRTMHLTKLKNDFALIDGAIAKICANDWGNIFTNYLSDITLIPTEVTDDLGNVTDLFRTKYFSFLDDDHNEEGFFPAYGDADFSDTLKNMILDRNLAAEILNAMKNQGIAGANGAVRTIDKLLETLENTRGAEVLSIGKQIMAAVDNLSTTIDAIKSFKGTTENTDGSIVYLLQTVYLKSEYKTSKELLNTLDSLKNSAESMKTTLENKISAVDAVYRQYKTLFTRLNDLEIQWKNWRSDPVEHLGMLDAVNVLKKDTVNYGAVMQDVITICNYVEKYKANRSLFAEWQNFSNYDADMKVPGDNGTTITAKVKELQTRFGGWTQNENAKSALLQECWSIFNAPLASDKQVAFNDFYATNTSSYTNAQKFFLTLFKRVSDYQIKDRSVVPGRCVPAISGTADTFLPIPSRSVTVNGQSQSQLALFSPIDAPSQFVEPAQETVPKSHWESAKIILNNLPSIGEDSLPVFINKQTSELANFTNHPQKNGFHKLNLALRDIKSKIDTYLPLKGSANRNIVLSLIKWYNAIVDFGAQYVKSSLQQFVNDSLWNDNASLREIENTSDGTSSNPDTNWKVASANTMLKYLQLSDGSLYYSYPTSPGGSQLFQTISLLKNTFIQNNTLKAVYKNKANDIKEIKNAQDYVTNMLKQYNDLSEEQKNTYDSLSIRAYISNLRKSIAGKFCDYNKETDTITSKMIEGGVDNLPPMTRDLLVAALKQLDNLTSIFEASEITRQVNTFYDWFINIEKLYYDWKINSASRKKLIDQLELLKEVHFHFELPKAIANNQELNADNVEIRTSVHMTNMMTQLRSGVTQVNTILDSLKGGNPKINATDRTNAEISLKAALPLLENTQRNREFRSIDDYFTCKDIITNLQEMLTEMKNYTSTDAPEDKISSWIGKMSSSDAILRIVDNDYYFSTEIKTHMNEIQDHIRLFEIAMPNNNNARKYEVIADRYGFTGDCDDDQVAVVRLMEKIRESIGEEFAAANEHRGSTLLSAQIAGRAVDFAVPTILDSNDRMHKYHRCWLDFERYASYLIANFVQKNPNKKMKKDGASGGADATSSYNLIKYCEGIPGTDFASIANGNKCDGRLLNYYAGTDTEEPAVLQTRLNNLQKVGNSLTTIDYATIYYDYSLDCLKLYRDYFLAGLRDDSGNVLVGGQSVFQNMREYMSFQGAYLDVQDYIKYLFEQYEDWRSNSSVNGALREALVDLRSQPLNQRVDLSYEIPTDDRTKENPLPSEKQTNGKVKYCSQIETVVSGVPSTLADYISILNNNVYSYSASRDPEAIYGDRLNQIDSTLREVLGSDTSYDHAALFNTKIDTLISGGPIIPSDTVMETLITKLEALVKAWNRSDEETTKKVFNEMNQDGVYILQSDNSYLFMGTKDTFKGPFPHAGMVKTIAGAITTYETYAEGSITTTETKSTVDTVRNRLITNELLGAIDSLKTVYLNGKSIQSIGEVYYRLQMAEYISAMAGGSYQNLAWHSPTGSGFLKNNGCYTFTMGSGTNEAKFICGIMNGSSKVIQLLSAEDVDLSDPPISSDISNALAKEFSQTTNLEAAAPLIRAIDNITENITLIHSTVAEMVDAFDANWTASSDAVKAKIQRMITSVQDVQTQIDNAKILAADIQKSTDIGEDLKSKLVTVNTKLDSLKTNVTNSLSGGLNAANGSTNQNTVKTQLTNGKNSLETAKNYATVVDQNGSLAQYLSGNFLYAWIRQRELIWFEGKKDLQGVFYVYGGPREEPVLSTHEFSIVAGGQSYYSARGGLFDGNGNVIITDKDGFLLDIDGKRIVKDNINVLGANSTVAYRMDILTGHLLVVEYNSVTQTEIESSAGPVNTYGTRFGNHRGMFHSGSCYLSNEKAHEQFVEEFNNIGTDFGIVYENWKRSAQNELFSATSATFSAQVAQYAEMFSSIGDLLSRHDVKRYREKLAYTEEELMLKKINTLIKNFDATDEDFKNFTSVASRAKAYYEVLNRVALAKSIGNVESADEYEAELPSKKQDYENAKLNAAKAKGNLPAYVQSLAKDLDEGTAQMKYLLSTQSSPSIRAQIVASHGYKVKKCEVASRILEVSLGVDTVAKEMDELLANNGLQKNFRDVYNLIQEGNSKYSERPVLSLSELWAAEKEIGMQVYEGWRGDSRDAQLYQSVLREFKERSYFKNSEEVPLIGSDGVREYIDQMDTLLETYAEELKRYETYDGILNNVYAMDVIKDGMKKKIAGFGFNELIKENANWFVTRAGKAAFQEALNHLAGDLDLIIASHDKGGELAMDPVLLKKIKAFKGYLGEKDGEDTRTYIGRVNAFTSYDDETQYSKEQYLYELQAMELKGIMEPYEAKKIGFEEYQEKIKALKTQQGGPLDDYIEQLQGYMDYAKQVELYHQSLMNMVPIGYVSYRGEWRRAVEMSDAQLKETNGQTYYRLVSGYGKNGEVQYIEDYDPNDEIVRAVYVSSDSLWHGDYTNYGVLFKLMAILYEKFTTQKNLLEDLLKEIQANNEKITEANKYLAKINKTQAQAAKQGENAKAVIPADVILFFRQRGIPMPSEFFGNDAEIKIYEQSDFNKRMSYLDEKNKGISNVLSYVAQGKLEGGDAVNITLGDLTNQDLLELGSLKEIYDQTDFADAGFKDTSNKARSADPMAAFLSVLSYVAIAYLTVITGGLMVGYLAMAVIAAAMATELEGKGLTSKIYGTQTQFHGTEQMTCGENNNLLEAYWENRKAVKAGDGGAQIKGTLNHYTNGLFLKMDGDLPPNPCTLEGIVDNNKCPNGSATNGFQLSNWAPATMGWGATGHFKYLANTMGEAAGTKSDDFTSGSNQHLVEAFDVLAHQKFYGRDKSVYKENYTEPDYDYNALILMYKVEALAEVYGDHIAEMAISYLSNRTSAANVIDGLELLSSEELKEQALTEEDVKLIKAAIDGPNLFTDDEDYPMHERRTLTQCWTAKNEVKGILNRLYGTGSKGLNADEVSLWSENMRMYIDKITTEGQTLSTKMQRMMQRCNETTSLATQMLKSIGDLWKQFTGNIR
ncbi:MAG: hypothetical protein LBR92_01245 [Puniceicoccales bacterium]|jgi:hypothetical protein|nr:hypothetical protein [Puniceicoccales bacterium]